MHCRTSGRGVRGGRAAPRVCLSSNRASLPLFQSLTLGSLSLCFPRSFFPSASLAFTPFVPVGYVRVPDSTLSSLRSSHPLPSLPRLPSSCALCCPLLFFFFFLSFYFFFLSFSPFFSPPPRDGTPASFPHRPAERKDCKPPDEPRIPEWGLLCSPVSSGCRRSVYARARANLGRTAGWDVLLPERDHQQLVAGEGYLSLSQGAF